MHDKILNVHISDCIATREGLAGCTPTFPNVCCAMPLNILSSIHSNRTVKAVGQLRLYHTNLQCLVMLLYHQLIQSYYYSCEAIKSDMYLNHTTVHSKIQTFCIQVTRRLPAKCCL